MRDVASSGRVILPADRSFTFMDAAQFLEANTRAISPCEQSVTFYLEGIHCMGCLWILESLPRVLAGVTGTHLNFGRAEITINYDPSKTRLSSIAALLNALGYPPHPIDDPRAELKSDRILLWRIGVAGFSAANCMMLSVSLFQGFFSGIDANVGTLFRWISLTLSLPALFFSALPFFRNSYQAVRLRRYHIDQPILLALLAAFALSTANTIMDRPFVYFDSMTALIFLLLIGRLVQQRALGRARLFISRGWEILPETARLVRGSTIEEVPARFVRCGEILEILPGTRVPADGIVIEGNSSIDTAVLTGESAPRAVAPGSELFASSLNLEGVLRCRVSAAAQQTHVGKLLASFESSGVKSQLVSLGERATSWFIPSVLVLSIVSFFLWLPSGLLTAIDNAVALLIVTCPCALALATPTAIGMAIGKAARRGILIKDGDTLERLARVKHVFLDKTGTLTDGNLVCVEAFGDDSVRPVVGELVKINSGHPISRALAQLVGNATSVQSATVGKLSPGRGVSLTNNGETFCLGSIKWLAERGVEVPVSLRARLDNWLSRGLVVVALDNGITVCGAFALRDSIRTDVVELLGYLQTSGRTAQILSGDNLATVTDLGKQLRLSADVCHGGLLPHEKSRIIEQTSRPCAMIGDGVNDAPALRSATVGIGLRGGIEATLACSDCFVSSGALRDVIVLFHGAESTLRIIRRNLYFSVFYNVIGGSMAMLGWMNPLMAALLMPLSSLTVILYSTRARTFVEI